MYYEIIVSKKEDSYFQLLKDVQILDIKRKVYIAFLEKNSHLAKIMKFL